MSITHKTKPDTEEEIIQNLNPLVKKWFFTKFKALALAQKYVVKEIHERNNVLVSAPTGSGKCVTPDTTILVENNGRTELVTGKDLIKIAEDRGKLITKVDLTGKLYNVPNLNSYSLADNNLLKSKALIYFEDYEGEIYNIKTEYGREIKLSPDHPLLIETDNGQEWIQAKNLVKGQKIGVPVKIDLPEEDILLNSDDTICNLRKRDYIAITYSDYIRLREKTNNFNKFDTLNIKELYEIKTLINSSFSEISLFLGIGMTTVFRVFNRETEYGKSELFSFFSKKCKSIVFEKNRIIVKNNGNNTFSFTYPDKVDVKLARWIAFVMAEGIIGNYKLGTHLLVSQKNRINLLNEFLDNTKKIFGLEFKKRTYKDYVINSSAFCYFLCDLLDLKRGRGRNVPFPNWLLNSKREVKSNFIYVFFSLESNVPKDGREIVLFQANKNKIELLNYLLSSFGIVSSLGKRKKYATNTKNKTKRDYYSISIRHISNLIIFVREIGLDHQNIFLLEKQIKKKTSGECIFKHRFDYKKLRNLSQFYKNDIEFKKELGNIYEVVLRTGYITNNALLRLKEKINLLNQDKHIAELLNYIDSLLEKNICWLKIKEINIEKYNGKLVDLTVPDVYNFIGGHGGIYLHNTLTAFLSIINELVNLAEANNLEDKVYAIYISPLKALNNDIFVNLETPLREIEKIAKEEGKDINIRVTVRTGDTSPKEKQKMLKTPPHILVTTPESLAIVLSSTKFSEYIKELWWVVVDEVHALAENKRGVHLSLSLERLNKLSQFTRIGLSATVAPLDEIAKYLVGEDRDCKIIDIQFAKQTDIKVISPVKDLVNATHEDRNNSLYTKIHELIQEHKTTLIFTNTRAATERVVHNLREKYPSFYKDTPKSKDVSKEISENKSESNSEELLSKEDKFNPTIDLIGAHHGSLSKKHRLNIENQLREGKLRAVVCSTSLELGIDIGYVDLVILLGSPKSVARALQRIGRSGHKLHETAKGRILVLDRDDLIECSLILKEAMEKKIDRIHIPKNCLDVLAQQIFGMAISDVCEVEELFDTIRKSYCYSSLDRSDFNKIIDYLSGEYVSLRDRYIFAKVWHKNGKIGRMSRMARVLYMTNIGTIPDQTSIKVKMGDEIIGTIDEGFLEQLKMGDIFVLGGDVYQFRFSRGTTAQVVPAHGRLPTVPNWVSEMLPLSFDLSLGIQRFRKLMNDKFDEDIPKKEIIDFINSYLYVDENASESIYIYFKEQYNYSIIPHENKMLYEQYKEHYDKQSNDSGKTYHIFHSLYGRRVNDVLSRAIAYAIGRQQMKDVRVTVTDNGFVLTCDSTIFPMKAFSLLKSSELREVMKLALDKSEILFRRFRHCANRSLMILRSYKGNNKSVGRQTVSSRILMSAVKRISNDFPILKEARREVLEDKMDIDNAILVLSWIESGKVKIEEINTTLPSPFAFNLALSGYSDILKIEDKIEFVKRLHTMVLAKISLEQGKKGMKESSEKRVMEAIPYDF